MTAATLTNRKLENQLIDILEREVGIYEELIEVKFREKEALIAFATTELDECTHFQEALVNEATQLEYKRRSIVNSLAEDKEFVGEEPTLSEVAAWISTESSEKVRSLGDELRSLFTEIARSQDANASLIQGATAYIHRTVDTLISKSKENPFAYAKSGAKATLKETIPGLLDRKA